MRGRVYVADADSANEDAADDEVSEATDVDVVDHFEEPEADGGADGSGGDARHAGEADPSCPVAPSLDLDEPVDGEAGAVAAGGVAGRAADAGPSGPETPLIDIDEAADGDVADHAADAAPSGPEVFFIGEGDEVHDDASEEDDCWNVDWPEAAIAFCTDGIPIPLHSP